MRALSIIIILIIIIIMIILLLFLNSLIGMFCVYFTVALENHYKNCNFYTTGQQIVIVSPGAGVFEVRI